MLPSERMRRELQLGLGDRSLVVLAMELGDWLGSRVRLLTRALVSLCVEPRRCCSEVPLSIMPPDTVAQGQFANACESRELRLLFGKVRVS